MSNLMLAAIILMVMAMAYQLGLARSRRLAHGGTVRLHSRPVHYGVLVALWCGLPALLILGLWSWLEPAVIRAQLLAALPEADELSLAQLNEMTRRLYALASGDGVIGEVQAFEIALAERLARWQTIGHMALLVTLAAALGAGLLVAWRRISPALRARNHVEVVIRATLILCSGVAILTTIGIVLSMFSEAMRFFTFVSPLEFFFGTEWDPRFSSVGTGAQGSFGAVPLFVGTLMVSSIALLVAIPIGLMSAIYMAEYAPGWLRSVAKPVIEVLAGIPTIVYGVFALMVIGPMFAAVGDAIGLQVRATSALTAGFVMGIMIIPFVSSLSDDIITQVPRSLRDASLGLGATRSETIRKVVLPAALPGIVGAFLLAASRAIGETMIVVLAAGNSPKLHGNPLEAVSTVTVSIVNQLTGDTDFAGPQSLVAFALGLTLFVVTLGLNVVALYIVRKYREQYD